MICETMATLYNANPLLPKNKYCTVHSSPSHANDLTSSLFRRKLRDHIWNYTSAFKSEYQRLVDVYTARECHHNTKLNAAAAEADLSYSHY